MSLQVEATDTLGDVRLDVAFAVEAGRCLAIAGPSGAGKSSILRIIAGLRRPETGRVVNAGTVWLDTAGGVDRPAQARRCGFVFQDYALFPHRTAAQNVADALRDRPRRVRASEARAWLARFDVDHRADARPATLSGGERQRVALARALAREPDVLLLDEPLAALDAGTRASASRYLSGALAANETPSVLVTHDFAQAALLGDEIAVVSDGRIVQRGTAAELAARPASAFVADFAGAVVLHGRAVPGRAGGAVVTLASGAVLRSTDVADGPVAATVYPWEISLWPATGDDAASSMQNRLEATVGSVTDVGGRVRVQLEGPDPVAAEVTTEAAAELGLGRGVPVVARWKATATRLVPLRD